ncbi:MAG: type II toxin-antitoxin system CcdA family antitoxin [Pseudomonadota bacterium]|nr:type II toxin-antitoxin system CcdA family antitoxin [Pseudomonadota bacterium]MDP2352688.1 type II toxin-antitoxin system CcdA family antitoxin [Pseudomonadota bacterium]
MKPAINHQSHKRPFNLLLNEGTVKQARSFTNNHSATVNLLLADHVAKRYEEMLATQKLVDAVAER